MNNKEIIKKVLDNLQNYEVSIHYATNKSKMRLEFIKCLDDDIGLFGGFKIENILDSDVLIVNKDHIPLDYFQTEKIIQFLNSKEHIRNFYDGIKSYDVIKKYLKITDAVDYFRISDEYVMIINDHMVTNITEFNDYVEFYCSNDSLYSYNLINDLKNRKWFHKDGDEILIFNKELSLI